MYIVLTLAFIIFLVGLFKASAEADEAMGRAMDDFLRYERALGDFPQPEFASEYQEAEAVAA